MGIGSDFVSKVSEVDRNGDSLTRPQCCQTCRHVFPMLRSPDDAHDLYKKTSTLDAVVLCSENCTMSPRDLIRSLK